MSPDEPGGLTRRRFAQVTVKTGLAAGAAIWVAPQLSSVALAQDAAGSPPPSPPPSVAPGTASRPSAGPANPVAAGEASRAPGGAPGAGAGGGVAGGGAPGAGGELPFTGSDVRTLAATGGAAVLGGSALVAAERLRGGGRRPAIAAEDWIDETAE
jgi:hypothetical protein